MARHEKVAIVTGGASGIGLACARRFARTGYRVVIADMSDEKGAQAQEELTGNGWQALHVHCDISDRLNIHNLMAATLDAYERVDVLVNNAAIMAGTDFLTLEEADFERVMRVNLMGAFLTGQAVARQMVRQIEEEATQVTPDESISYAIVNMSSINAEIASPEQLAYAVSKSALNHLTRLMALSLAPHGIRVNAIGPGAINTDIMKPVVRDAKARQAVLDRTPLGRIGEADEIASIATFLASKEASYITGQCIYADGGRLPLNYTVQEARSVE